MTEPVKIIVPLLNPNEPGALLAKLLVVNGQHVSIGDSLCTFETTKATAELTAEVDGYILGLKATNGQTLQAGEILCYLSATLDWIPPEEESVRISSPSTPPGLRISQAALVLAQQHNLDLTQLSEDVFITENIVRNMINRSQKPSLVVPEEGFPENSIIVYGGGGHGKALIDLLRTLGTHPIAGIVDDDPDSSSTIMGVRVLGGGSILETLIEHGVHLAVNAVGGIGNIRSRIKVFERLAQAGFTCPALVHPTAFIEPSATLAGGVQVMPNAYIGSEAKIGYGVIINTGVIVSHDCILGDYSNLSPGAILAGEVTIGEASLIGMGVTINLRVTVGNHARVGNGATVKQDVPSGNIVHAGTIWPA